MAAKVSLRSHHASKTTIIAHCAEKRHLEHKEVMPDTENKLCYDLHSHSTSSDGELSPTDLVKYAHDKGVTELALTDHDNTAGIAEARLQADQLGMNLINGVEVSSIWNNRLVHIVGLNFDTENQALQKGLADLRKQREERGEKIGRRLEKLGICGALAGARQFSNGQILSRTHFARYLVESGVVKNPNEAFKKYLGDGKPACVTSEWASMEQTVEWIKGAGGHAVIAHPARYKLSATRLRLFIEDFVACGGQGFEVVSGSQDAAENRKMADYALRYELYASKGSDYHGPNQPWLSMGRMPDLPAACTPIWSLWEH